MLMPRRDLFANLARTAALATVAGDGMSRLAAADRVTRSDIVRFEPEMEPLVRLVEDTPRQQCVEAIARKLRSGLSYRQLLAAVFLAGIRNINPQPPGFKLHCVFVLHSAHQLSLDASHTERLLPLLWALDYFKRSQAEDVAEGDFRLLEVQGALPSASKAWQEYHAAMESWDVERADRAIAVLARSQGAHELMEGLWRHGARDYRNIGHKAIFVANTWRTLQTIGWQYAEPALRSLTLGLLDFGPDLRMNGYRFEDQSHASNSAVARATLATLPDDWVSTASPDPSATTDILAAIREFRPIPVGNAVAGMLAKGSARASDIWTAVHLAAGELMMRLPGILGVHCVTSANALHYAFRMAGDPETRLYLALQAAGWMSQFGHFMSGQDGFRAFRIDRLESAEVSDDPQGSSGEILKLLTEDADLAARKAHGHAVAHPGDPSFARAARTLLFNKVRDSHHFKYAAAAFEDLSLVDPAWQPHMLATSTYYLRGSEHPDSQVVQRARAALHRS